ncbi:hypothetical protein [Paenibacillus alvei]|uniref:YhfM-like domain-containing protein n=1 Tax=Paenibacillus alvei TaxID=44250 RepID=A0AAP7DLA3_PAEAL|nr:hypothetical protein [Paenibacillus alvei]NOJ73509.1 hypothetical protein [Paenibacillus alvei]
MTSRELIFIQKGIVAITILLLLLLTTGCEEERYMISIKLECEQTSMAKICSNYESNDEKVIQKFERAIETATKMSGELNYVPQYKVTIHYSDNAVEQYHLSIGTDQAKKRIVVNLAASQIGYEIGKSYTNQLRKILGQ